MIKRKPAFTEESLREFLTENYGKSWKELASIAGISDTGLKHYVVKWGLQESVISKQEMRRLAARKAVASRTRKSWLESRAKAAETNERVYGGSSPMSSSSVRDKTRQTCQQRYGVDNPLKLDKVRKAAIENSHSEKALIKQRRTLRQHYGVDNPSQSEEILDRRSQTNLDRYGVTTVVALDRIKEKATLSRATDECKLRRAQTNIARYGASTYLNSEEGRAAIRETFIRKYGSLTHRGNPEVEENIRLGRLRSKCRENPNYINVIEPQAFIEATKDCPSVGDLSRKWNIDASVIYRFIHKYNLHDRVQDKSGAYTSDNEREIRQYIESLGFSTEKTKSSRANYEIDVYVPDLKVGFEHNGLYWHSDLVHSDRLYHQKKSLWAEQKGIKLIHIWEDEWEYKQDKCKSLIRTSLGLNVKIYARQVKVKRAEPRQLKEFLERNHIQGYANAEIAYALVNEGSVVGCMTFSKARYTNKFQYEVVRECYADGYTIIGGSSKLFKEFLRDVDPRSVVTYVDFSKFRGDHYLRLGFKLRGLSYPSFRWYLRSKGITLNRNPQRHQELKHLPRCYNSGQLSFVWSK